MEHSKGVLSRARMKASEISLWNYFKRSLLTSKLHPCRHENLCHFQPSFHIHYWHSKDSFWEAKIKVFTLSCIDSCQMLVPRVVFKLRAAEKVQYICLYNNIEHVWHIQRYTTGSWAILYLEIFNTCWPTVHIQKWSQWDIKILNQLHKMNKSASRLMCSGK